MAVWLLTQTFDLCAAMLRKYRLSRKNIMYEEKKRSVTLENMRYTVVENFNWNLEQAI